MSTLDTLKEIIATEFGVNRGDIELSSNLRKDLGLDSLDLVELVMAVEQEFAIDIPDDDADKLLTFGDVVNYVEENK